MELATLIGLILGFGGVLGGFIMEGGKMSSLVEPSAMIIVFGGSLGATVISFSLKNVTSVPQIIKNAFFVRHTDPVEMLRIIVDLAKKARQSGILALEAELNGIQSEFLRKAIQLVVDGTQPELVREILETEIDAMRVRHKHGIEFFMQWGGYAPTLGVLGTVMGLVHMLENLSDPGNMGPAIAVAFIATFYGVGSANLIFLPIAAKLKLHSQEEIASYEMAVEGILSLQAGENPRVVSTKMRSYLAPKIQRVIAEED
ncbi:MAG TPA: flagellar motor protein [Armatimonadota bacterium]|nr:flagellar motor protein [Armatimonadota bacterium]